MKQSVNLDRMTETSAVLHVGADIYDVYGDTWGEIKASAQEIADWLGVSIDTFNSEMPE